MEPAQCIKKGVMDPQCFKAKTNKLYPIGKCKCPHSIVNVMLFRLYGQSNPNHFREEQVPLFHGILQKVNVFNWANILSHNLTNEIREALSSPPCFKPPFFMSSYLLDVIIVVSPLPSLEWFWIQDKPFIHQYYSIMATIIQTTFMIFETILCCLHTRCCITNLLFESINML